MPHIKNPVMNTNTMPNFNPMECDSISSCCSEDESYSSHELRGGASSSLSKNNFTALKLSGK